MVALYIQLKQQNVVSVALAGNWPLICLNDGQGDLSL